MGRDTHVIIHVIIHVSSYVSIHNDMAIYLWRSFFISKMDLGWANSASGSIVTV